LLPTDIFAINSLTLESPEAGDDGCGAVQVHVVSWDEEEGKGHRVLLLSSWGFGLSSCGAAEQHSLLRQELLAEATRIELPSQRHLFRRALLSLRLERIAQPRQANQTVGLPKMHPSAYQKFLSEAFLAQPAGTVFRVERHSFRRVRVEPRKPQAQPQQASTSSSSASLFDVPPLARDLDTS
jgi:hypothetical protein